MEIKSHSKELSPVNNIKQDVIKALSLYYYTFVDLLDFKVGFGGEVLPHYDFAPRHFRCHRIGDDVSW